MAEEASESQLRAAAGGAVGFGYGHDRKATLRTSARRQAGLQPEQARAAVACLSHLVHCQPADRPGRGGAGRKSDGLVVCAAGVVGAAGWAAGAEPPGVFAWRLWLGNGAGDGRSRAAPYSLPVQTEADGEREETDRQAVRQN